MECKAINCSEERNTCYYTDYCSYHRECLDKLFKKTNKIWYENNKIHEMETFETWFNKNCGYIATYNCLSSHLSSVWLIIYEPNENWSVIKYKHGFCSFSESENEARELKKKLQNNGFHDTPMLKVHSDADYFETFYSLIKSPYVVKENWYHKITEPSLYFKPLDIAKVNGKKAGVNFDHVGIYIGNDSVCHFTKKCNGVRIHSWSDFLEDYHTGDGTITRYHPIIPFKNYRKIARQIGWAREREFREDDYSLGSKNCEHFANMIVYGINYSEQAEDKKGLLITKNIAATSLFPLPSLIFNTYSINNGKGSTIKLTDEMEETNDELGWKTNEHSKAIERRYLQEVPPKEPCRIM